MELSLIIRIDHIATVSTFKDLYFHPRCCRVLVMLACDTNLCASNLKIHVPKFNEFSMNIRLIERNSPKSFTEESFIRMFDMLLD